MHSNGNYFCRKTAIFTAKTISQPASMVILWKVLISNFIYNDQNKRSDVKLFIYSRKLVKQKI